MSPAGKPDTPKPKRQLPLSLHAHVHDIRELLARVREVAVRSNQTSVRSGLAGAPASTRVILAGLRQAINGLSADRLERASRIATGKYAASKARPLKVAVVPAQRRWP
ncbi:MAG: hypothetical protein ABI885_17420 [Gammaproteobacteria bacterium]